jgi:hypothetical protein
MARRGAGFEVEAKIQATDNWRDAALYTRMGGDTLKSHVAAGIDRHAAASPTGRDRSSSELLKLRASAVHTTYKLHAVDSGVMDDDEPVASVRDKLMQVSCALLNSTLCEDF